MLATAVSAGDKIIIEQYNNLLTDVSNHISAVSAIHGLSASMYPVGTYKGQAYFIDRTGGSITGMSSAGSYDGTFTWNHGFTSISSWAYAVDSAALDTRSVYYLTAMSNTGGTLRIKTDYSCSDATYWLIGFGT